MYTFAALINSTKVTCCFPVETAGGDDATLGRSQSSHSLLCDAPGLGRHSRYCAARLHNNLTTTLSIYMCYINILGGNRYLFVVSNRWKPEFLQDKSVCGGNPKQFRPFFSCFNVDASVPPDDGREAAHCWTRSWHRGVVGPVQSSRHDSQWPVLPRWAMTVFSLHLSPLQWIPDRFLYCRPSACFHTLALGLDAQLWRRRGEFHESAWCSGQSYPVTSWCATGTQWTNRPLQDSRLNELSHIFQ